MAEALRRGVQGGTGDGDGTGDGSGDGAGGSGKPAQGDPPLGDKAPPKDDATAAKLAAMQKENAELKAAEEKRVADAEAAKKKAAEDAAKKKGEYEPLLAKKDEELSEAERKLKAAVEENQSLKKAVVDRIEANIKALPEAAQAEIKLVRESLSLDKLQELVDLKAKAAGGGTGDVPPRTPAPNPGGMGGGHKKGKDYEIHAETRMVMEELYVEDGVFETSKNMGRIDMGDGDYKYRYRGTGDDKKDTKSFIGMLRGVAQRSKEDMVDRMRDASAQK